MFSKFFGSSKDKKLKLQQEKAKQAEIIAKAKRELEIKQQEQQKIPPQNDQDKSKKDPPKQVPIQSEPKKVIPKPDEVVQPKPKPAEVASEPKKITEEPPKSVEIATEQKVTPDVPKKVIPNPSDIAQPKPVENASEPEQPKSVEMNTEQKVTTDVPKKIEPNVEVKTSEVDTKVVETKDDEKNDVNKSNMDDTKNILNTKLSNRKSAEEVGINTKIAPAIQSTVKTIENKKRRDSLSKQMKNRPTASEVGINTKIAPSLQKTVRELDHKRRRLSISEALNARPESQELIDMGILKPYANKLANALQMNADKLEKLLALRVDEEYLKKKNILSPKGDIKKGFEYTVDKTSIADEKNMEETTAELLTFLMNRPSKSDAMDEIGLSGINNDNIAPVLQSNVKSLEMEMNKNKLNKALKNRPDQLPQNISIGNDIAPSIQSTILALGRELIKNKLKKELQMIPSQSSKVIYKDLAPSMCVFQYIFKNILCVYIFGILYNNIGLQKTAKELENKQRRDSLKHNLERRPKPEEIGIDIKTSSVIQGKVKELQKQKIKDQVSQGLRKRRESEEKVDISIAPALQATVKTLENKQRRKSISDKLNARPDITELVDRGILKPYANTLSKTLQMEANELEELLLQRVDEEYLKKIGVLEPYKHNVDDASITDDKKMQATSAHLLHALLMRPSKSTAMEEAGGLPKNIAPVIQSNVKSLEMQINKNKLKKAMEHDKKHPIKPELLGINNKVDGSLQQTLLKLSKQFIVDDLNNFFRHKKAKYNNYPENYQKMLTNIDELIRFIDTN